VNVGVGVRKTRVRKHMPVPYNDMSGNALATECATHVVARPMVSAILEHPTPLSQSPTRHRQQRKENGIVRLQVLTLLDQAVKPMNRPHSHWQRRLRAGGERL
jgi:hypothetical protein